MIEFALLFALGFLTAAVLGLLAAPVVHRRVVRFAEDRLKATMPLSPQEVRAQKDAARAGYAAENARTSQALVRARDKAVSLMLDNEAIGQKARKLAADNADLQVRIADMNAEAENLKSFVRQLELNVERLKSTLAAVENDNDHKVTEIKSLSRKLDHVKADADSLRIDVVANNTEAENLKSRIAALRDERDALRETAKAEASRAREMEARLAREETRIRQLEARVSKEMASNADKDNALERRAAEIDRLKTKLKESGQDLRDASRALRSAGLTLPVRKPANPGAVAPSSPVALPKPAATIDLTAPTEYARNSAAAVSERLMNAKTSSHDEALRDEIANIAATMVAITALREGATSPIRALLEKAPPTKDGGRRSLARRAAERLPPEA